MMDQDWNCFLLPGPTVELLWLKLEAEPNKAFPTPYSYPVSAPFPPMCPLAPHAVTGKAIMLETQFVAQAVHWLEAVFLPQLPKLCRSEATPTMLLFLKNS